MWIEQKGGGSYGQLAEVVERIIAKARTRPELAWVNTTIRANGQQLLADVDREKAEVLGVPVQDARPRRSASDTTPARLAAGRAKSPARSPGRSGNRWTCMNAEYRPDKPPDARGRSLPELIGPRRHTGVQSEAADLACRRTGSLIAGRPEHQVNRLIAAKMLQHDVALDAATHAAAIVG